MSNVQTENLEERMERIRLRNEELEKKYREAEEDRLMAMKENAMVEIRPPRDEDWPREHKYDKLDFTYDQKEISVPDENAKKTEIAQQDEASGLKPQDPLRKSKREFKKFSEGDGPPPDPAYNFLADAERDGKPAEVIERKSFESKPGSEGKKDWKHNNSANRGGRGGGRGGGGRGGNKSSPRGGGGGIGSRGHDYGNDGENTWKATEKSDRGSKSFDGPRQESNWRRDEGRQNGGEKQKNRSPTNIRQLNRNDSTGGGGDPRSNIMVSVSQNENGEVKSVIFSRVIDNEIDLMFLNFYVLVTSAPIIGTGRVGPRQVTKPQFQIQKEHLQNEYQNSNNFNQSAINHQNRRSFNRKDNNSFNNMNSNYNKSRPARSSVQGGDGEPNGENTIVNRSSVNDRLKRIVSANGNTKSGVQEDQMTISVNN